MKRKYYFWDIIGKTTNAYFYEEIQLAYETGKHIDVISGVKRFLEHVMGDQLAQMGFYKKNMTFEDMIDVAKENKLITFVTASKLHSVRKLRNRFEHFTLNKPSLPSKNSKKKAYLSVSVLSQCLEELLQIKPNIKIVIYSPYALKLKFKDVLGK